jgi:hypothetical protein
MGLFKTLIKLVVLLMVGAIIAGIVTAIMRSNDSPISFEEWPSVPRNPEA